MQYKRSERRRHDHGGAPAGYPERRRDPDSRTMEMSASQAQFELLMTARGYRRPELKAISRKSASSRDASLNEPMTEPTKMLLQA